ncbi:MAG: PD-(D/E)XK nuclease family protein, partial [Bryobacteraceae bacterium]
NHAILGDHARRRLRENNIVLRTSEDRQREEEFLFRLATSRATESLILSRPLRDGSGADMPPSSFLEGEAAEAAPPARPRPLFRPATPRKPAIAPGPGRAALARRTSTVSPSAIESFLQCPFQFFAGRVLRLRVPKPPPEERLNPLLEGSILHDVLAALPGAPLLAESVFAQVFEEHCRREGVPAGWRKEAVRLEMLRGLRAFLEDVEHALKAGALVEQKFELPLGDDQAIRGRIDRIDIDDAGAALVIDYKYTTAGNLADLLRAHRDGRKVQAGLYAMAVRELWRHKVSRVRFLALRGAAGWRGWEHDEIDELVESAVELTRGAVKDIRAGRIAPEPADPDKCAWCDFRDLCRVEVR